jgi:DTW domain-containing protein YfiP
MENPPNKTPSKDRHRDRCYGCFRPKEACFCSKIPSIENRTDILILQHVRERFHPFNTARIVHRALNNSRVIVEQTERLLTMSLPIGPRTGVLYPGPEAQLFSEVPASERPDQLVIVDGTWHHAKTLIRDLPALRDLPKFTIAPASPGRYRIRREPTATSLSTLEATVAALRELEPETEGLDELLGAFDAMVEGQLAHPRSQFVPRSDRRRNRTSCGVPRVLVQQLEHVVVAYGESPYGGPGTKRTGCSPVYWVAERLGTGETFARTIQPEIPLNAKFLGHLELSAQDFSGALSREEFRREWADFLAPTDTVAVYSQGTARLLAGAGADFAKCLVLKSVPVRFSGTLEEVLAKAGLTCPPPRHPGRAGRRLANAIALVRHLSRLGAARQPEE